MFPQPQEEVERTTMVGETAGADQLDLEAAEQLIQLSGGNGADDGGSESRSADSVKCCGPDQARMKKKDKEEAVESHRRRSTGRFVAGKDGGGGAPVRRNVDSVNRCSRAAGTEEKGNEEEPAVESHRMRSAARFPAGKYGVGVVDDGEGRRRPRFRWLADIYRDIRQLTARDPGAAGGNVPPEADEKRKRAADADDENVVAPVVSKESKERIKIDAKLFYSAFSSSSISSRN